MKSAVKPLKMGWLLLGLILLSGVHTGMGNESLLKETLQKGERLFSRNCAPCHGEKAIGQNPEEPYGGKDKQGVLQAPALNGKGHAWHHPDDVLFQWIKQGSPLEESPMRGWEGRMIDEEIWAVILYFQSLWPERLRQGRQGKTQEK